MKNINKFHTPYGTNTFVTIDRDLLDSMKDPFLFLKCNTCGAVEGLPVDQTRTDFSAFVVYYDDESPDGCFYGCTNCRAFSDITIDIDEGTE